MIDRRMPTHAIKGNEIYFNGKECENLWLHKIRDNAIYCQMEVSLPLNVPCEITFFSILFVLEERLSC